MEVTDRKNLMDSYHLSVQMLGLSEIIFEAVNYLIESTNNYLPTILLDLESAFLHLENSLQSVIQLQESDALVFTMGNVIDISDLNNIRAHWEHIRITVLSANDSLNRVCTLYKTNATKAQNKVKYELIPFCIVLYERIWEVKNILADYVGEERTDKANLDNKFKEDKPHTGSYKYKLSVCVTAYNKLEYTKLCVESLIQFMPDYLSYELILVNHGSNDGTKEYFESVCPTKQVDVLINGAFFPFALITEGKYFLPVSNDVIVTKNAIKNLLICMESNEDYGYVVPTTSNVSNLQTIGVSYQSLEEMHLFAEKNNQSDPYRWEQRFRLCNPICLLRSDYSKENPELQIKFEKAKGSKVFSDDSVSYYLRRKGYKNILAKDAYCHHFGSVTIKEQMNKKTKSNNDFYSNGRKIFKEELGIDPWGLGFCFDLELYNSLDYHKHEHVDILAINCGYGSTPLKIKESLRETSHNEDTDIYAFTDWTDAAIDAEILSDYFFMSYRYSDIFQKAKNRKFDYIVQEDNFKNCLIQWHDIQSLYNMLKENGYLAIKNLPDFLRRKIAKHYKHILSTPNWNIIICKDKAI